MPEVAILKPKCLFSLDFAQGSAGNPCVRVLSICAEFPLLYSESPGLAALNPGLAPAGAGPRQPGWASSWAQSFAPTFADDAGRATFSAANRLGS